MSDLRVTSMAQVAALFGAQPQTVRSEWKAWLPEKPLGGWDVAELIRLVRERDEKRLTARRQACQPKGVVKLTREINAAAKALAALAAAAEVAEQ